VAVPRLVPTRFGTACSLEYGAQAPGSTLQSTRGRAWGCPACVRILPYAWPLHPVVGNCYHMEHDQQAHSLYDSLGSPAASKKGSLALPPAPSRNFDPGGQGKRSSSGEVVPAGKRYGMEDSQELDDPPQPARR